MKVLYIIRYDEIGLKGSNRSMFEKQLCKNIKKQSRKTGILTHRIEGRILVEVDAEYEAELIEILNLTPGICSYSKAKEIKKDLEALKIHSLETLKACWKGDTPLKFRVSAKRSDKTYPMRSCEINTEVGAYLITHFGTEFLKVSLKEAELEIGLEIHSNKALVHSQVCKGLGGLPVGTAGEVLCLLSGGIDSPVAAYQMMRRGCRVHFVFFENRVFLGRAAYEKVLKLTKRLSKYQGYCRLSVVPFTDIQVAIRDKCRERNRVILYRRFMYRIAERLLEDRGYLGLVNGECLGQVASQTLENMKAVNDVVRAPVYRPLISMDKNEIVTIARKIDTFNISAEDAPDCCSVFMPSRPVTKAKLSLLIEDEAMLEGDLLIRQALEKIELIEV